MITIMSANERRLVGFIKEYASDVGETYLSGPCRGRDNLQKITGPIMAGASALLEGPDQLYAGAVGQEYQRPTGIGGRIRRDIGALLGDIVRLRPLRALGDAWRLATSDVILDAGDAIGGFRQSSRNALMQTLRA